MEQTSWSPAALLQLSGGYWSACALHAGVKLDVFTPLAESGMKAEELGKRLGADPRGLGMLLDALAALGLLEKEGEQYAASAFAAEFLDRTSPQYLGHIIMHHHHLMGSWTCLDEAVRTGRPVRDRVVGAEDEVVRESFLMGMFNLAMQLAPRVAEQIDLTGRRRLLDLGGGPGTYAVHFCLANPGLSAVVYDLPTTRSFAERTIERFGLSERVAFDDGDYLSRGIEGRYDTAWLSHILHGEGPGTCARILEKAMSALEPGGLIMVQEFILDDDRSGPLFPALFSLNMLVVTQDGQAYSQGELIRMLTEAGASEVRRLPIDLPNGAGIIAGRIPGSR